jgi:hypothetical protein
MAVEHEARIYTVKILVAVTVGQSTRAAVKLNMYVPILDVSFVYIISFKGVELDQVNTVKSNMPV